MISNVVCSRRIKRVRDKWNNYRWRIFKRPYTSQKYGQPVINEGTYARVIEELGLFWLGNGYPEKAFA